MTAATDYVQTKSAGLVPAKGTYGAAANVLLYGGTIVTIDGDGNADVVTAGQNAAGIAVADCDNRTTAPEGGAAGAVNCEVDFGVQGLAYSGTAPAPGDVVYVLDNKTVTLDSDTGSRGIAGYCTELRDGLCWTLMGPAIVGQIVIAATEASQLDTAQADIVAAEADIVALQTDALVERIVVPVTAFAMAAGAPLVAFSDGAADGLATDEGIMFRWNVDTTTPIWTTIPLPDYVDAGEDIVVRLLVSREGAVDTDVTVAVGAYLLSADDAYDADANAGDVTAAVDETTKTIAEKTVTIDAADVPASPLLLSLSIMPTTAKLDTDDFNLHGVVVEFTRAVTAP